MKKRANKPQDAAAEIARSIAVLHTWGIHSLGQLAALNKQELAARLGPAAVELWERANGKTMRPLKRVVPVEVFEEAFEFEQEIETAEPLLFMLRRFLQQFATRLGAMYVVAKELTLRITFNDKNSYERTFKIPEPTNSVDLLFRMLQTHLEGFKSEAPIIAVSLRAQPAKPGQQQFGLFETALRDPTQLAETLARLTALVGSDRVGTPVMKDTHKPDAFRMEPFNWQLPRTETAEEKLPRTALRRFRSSSAAVVLVDERKPAHVRNVNVNGRVMQQSGPFTSSGNWWNEKAWRRAEWDVQLENETICRCHFDGEQWRVDGVYD
jgi:protein ImuB